jgi:predicted nucleic acid-binding protein
VTVIDTSGLVDLLTDGIAAPMVGEMLAEERELAAPDVLVFEALSAIRRNTLKGHLSSARATAAVEDMADMPVQLFASLPLRSRAWELRENLTTADALFVSLAERLGEPLATKDRSLAKAASSLGLVSVISLAAG